MCSRASIADEAGQGVDAVQGRGREGMVGGGGSCGMTTATRRSLSAPAITRGVRFGERGGPSKLQGTAKDEGIKSPCHDLVRARRHGFSRRWSSGPGTLGCAAAIGNRGEGRWGQMGREKGRKKRE